MFSWHLSSLLIVKVMLCCYFSRNVSYFVVIMFLLFQSVAELAEDIWDRCGYDFGTDYSGLFKALTHINYNVRFAAAEALAAALDEYPDTIQVSMIFIFLLQSGSGLVSVSYGLVIFSGIPFNSFFFIHS